MREKYEKEREKYEKKRKIWERERKKRKKEKKNDLHVIISSVTEAVVAHEKMAPAWKWANKTGEEERGEEEEEEREREWICPFVDWIK